MPVSKKKSGKKRVKASTQVDIVFAGPLLLVPGVREGFVESLEVFAPCNGHPVGAVFMPGVLFTGAELDDPECARWPGLQSFSLLDPHSYALDLTQKTGGKDRALRASVIPSANHKVKPGRRLSSDWDVAITVRGRLGGWTSHRLTQVREGLFHGADAPTTETVASLHRLTYPAVTAADFCGASREAREYLRANTAAGGTLIVVGEIPYQPSLLHERRAIDAMARLAGLDLHLAETTPSAYKTRLMDHVSFCGFSTIVTE